jgi:nitrous oxide reductase accessory protein NosL
MNFNEAKLCMDSGGKVCRMAWAKMGGPDAMYLEPHDPEPAIVMEFKAGHKHYPEGAKQYVALTASELNATDWSIVT